ncbi:MAG: hypothetical protein WCF85_21845 [Rhodospirillaceae bacterium]
MIKDLIRSITLHPHNDGPWNELFRIMIEDRQFTLVEQLLMARHQRRRDAAGWAYEGCLPERCDFLR